MSSLRKKSVVAGFAALATTLGVVSLAWACGASLYTPFVTPGVNRVPAGSEVPVTGGNWAVSPEVEIRWEGLGRVETLLLVAPEQNGSLSATVTVPAGASPGLYYISAAQGAATSRPVSFEVATPGAAPADGSRLPALVGPQEQEPPSAGPTSRRTTGGAVVSFSPVAPAPEPVSVPRATAASPSATAPEGEGAASGSTTGLSPLSPSPGASPSGPIAAKGPGSSDQQPAARRSSAKVISGNLWSGFDASKLSPGLSDLSDLDRDRQGDSMVPGSDVLVYGALALVSGFGLAELRRRGRRVRPPD